MDQKPLDYNIHCKITFESFFQENNDNNLTNSNASQKIDGIYQLSLEKILGRHDIFYRHSHRVIARRKIIEITIPKDIIKHIDEMATHENIISLKFENRAGVIYDNDWIEGVK